MARILVLIEATRFSGPAKVVLETALKLRDEHEFIFVAFLRGNDSENEYISSIKKLGFKLEILREAYRFDPRAVSQLSAMVTCLQPQIIEAHNFKSSFFLMLLGKLSKSFSGECVHYYHGEVQSDLKQSVYNAVYRKILKRVDHIVVVSGRQKELLVKHSVDANSITIIRNGIEPFEGSPVRPSGTLLVLSVGRLSFEKGHDLLLQAISKVKAKNPQLPFSVAIVGEGPLLESLQQQSKRLGLEGIVDFKGYFPDTANLYKNSNVFVLPSRSEGIPMVILESALHGLPIVSFDVGGVKEVLPDEKSIVLVTPGDVDQLADGISDLLNDKSKREVLATEAMRIVKENFAADTRVKGIESLYSRLLADSKKDS